MTFPNGLMSGAIEFMLIFEMNELEENWADFVRQANQNATANRDIAEYLRLKETNDAARQVGVGWLLDAFQAVAAEANRRGMAISVEKKEPHSFSVGAATMQGALVRLKLGIRAVTVEAGFPRSPQDGFIRGGGLACARISHFGQAQANENLMLIKSDNSAPVWFVVRDNSFAQSFHIPRLKHHFETFVGRF